MSRTAPEPATLPAVHTAHLVQLLARWKVSATQLLSPLGLSLSQLEAPDARVTIAEAEAIVDRARLLTGEPGLGVYLGLAMRISWHGYLGFAAMTAKDLRGALELAERFVATRTTALEFRLRVSEKNAAVVLVERVALGRAQDVVILAVLIGLAEIGAALTGLDLRAAAEVTFEEPPWFSRFKGVGRLTFRFGRPSNRIVFTPAGLDLPLQLSDASAQRLALQQCEKELSALGFATRLAGKVRARLFTPGIRSLDDVARALALSSRTLKRRLAAEGTSYRSLLLEERKVRAQTLLCEEELSVEQVAQRLGYADAAAFTHAFTKWTGEPPGAWR